MRLKTSLLHEPKHILFMMSLATQPYIFFVSVLLKSILCNTTSKMFLWLLFTIVVSTTIRNVVGLISYFLMLGLTQHITFTKSRLCSFSFSDEPIYCTIYGGLWCSQLKYILYPNNSLFLTANHIRNLWVVLAGPQQMSYTHAVRTTRSSSGTCWPVRPLWLSNCQKTFTPLTYTGSPKPLVARNRTRLRSLSLPALMASLFIL